MSAPTAVVCTGQQVIVDTEQMGSLYGIVRWFREGNFGVQFQMPMALDRLNHARQAVPKGMRQRAGRARVGMPALVRYGDLRRQVLVGNIAVGGLMMTTRLPLRPTQSVMIGAASCLPSCCRSLPRRRSRGAEAWAAVGSTTSARRTNRRTLRLPRLRSGARSGVSLRSRIARAP